MAVDATRPSDCDGLGHDKSGAGVMLSGGRNPPERTLDRSNCFADNQPHTLLGYTHTSVTRAEIV